MNGISIACTGRVMTELEQNYTASGEQMLSFSMIVDENTTATAGHSVPESAWLCCTAWEEQATLLAKALRKGTHCYIEGRLRHGQWQTASGEDHCGLNVSCWKVDVHGAIGRRAPKREAIGVGSAAARIVPRS